MCEGLHNAYACAHTHNLVFDNFHTGNMYASTNPKKNNKLKKKNPSYIKYEIDVDLIP
jgi:hypothetical protein